jgi:hypothetical protein
MRENTECQYTNIYANHAGSRSSIWRERFRKVSLRVRHVVRTTWASNSLHFRLQTRLSFPARVRRVPLLIPAVALLGIGTDLDVDVAK